MSAAAPPEKDPSVKPAGSASKHEAASMQADTKPSSRPTDPAIRYRWIALIGIAVGAATMVAALSLAVHVHMHERSIQSALDEIRSLQEKQGNGRLPAEDLATLRQALTAKSSAADTTTLRSSGPAAPNAATAAIVEASLGAAPALFGQAEILLSHGDVANARKSYCRFLACGGEMRGGNADWVARARYRVLECDAKLMSRRLQAPAAATARGGGKS
ncbi:MAG: hypothetical protein HY292_00100 [Planctomycetes bacterium]|nr:hypothetical protein [Planctomycetota bacterium]